MSPLVSLLTLLLAAEVLASAAVSEIVLRELPLLFADDSGVAASNGVVRTVHPARTLSAPVIEPDRPWEGERVYVYGSVYADEENKLLRLWY
ncbi:MAG: hypothetical protein N2689_03645, partial [Verrucomicrobiae bacterium]|nr:hypothetical protein [Verrucomicrobiae bacterium]